MIKYNSSIFEFSKTIWTILKSSEKRLISLNILNELCELAFYASLKTEESRPVTFNLVYINPKNPDPKPPERIRNDRWKFIRFNKPIKLTISNLVKIALCSDPRSTSLAVYHDLRKSLYIYGLIDQGNSYNSFINYETDSGFGRPGIINLAVITIGHIIASYDFDIIAELRGNIIVRNAIDVFKRGVIRNSLKKKINILSKSIITKIKYDLKKDFLEYSSEFIPDLTFNWYSSLSRILLRIQNFHHGGAILVNSDDNNYGLNIKYPMKYDRLTEALRNNAELEYYYNYAADKITNEYIEKNSDIVPMDIYMKENLSNDDLIDNRNEINGSIWLISMLSRVDGLILMDNYLTVKGFGVEILEDCEPKKVYRASSSKAETKSLREIDYHHFGTRHRSMIRYCSKNPRSIGFVISQDGDVRCIKKVNNRLIIWENIKLNNLDYVSRKKNYENSRKYNSGSSVNFPIPLFIPFKD